MFDRVSSRWASPRRTVFLALLRGLTVIVVVWCGVVSAWCGVVAAWCDVVVVWCGVVKAWCGVVVAWFVVVICVGFGGGGCMVGRSGMSGLGWVGVKCGCWSGDGLCCWVCCGSCV